MFQGISLPDIPCDIYSRLDIKLNSCMYFDDALTLQLEDIIVC